MTGEAKLHPASPRSRAARQAVLLAQHAAPPADAVDKPQPPAVRQLEELRALRFSANGPIAPAPPSFTAGAVRKWLADIAAVGSAGDVEVAWYCVQDHRLKNELMLEYERLKAIADQRHNALLNRAGEERRRAVPARPSAAP